MMINGFHNPARKCYYYKSDQKGSIKSWLVGDASWQYYRGQLQELMSHHHCV